MPVRLLFVSHSLPRSGLSIDNVGGMQRVALELHDALLAHDDVAMEPLVLRSAWKGLYRKLPGYFWRAYRRIRRQAERGEVDVVLFSGMVTASLAVWLRGPLRRHGVRTATICHGLDVTMPNPVYQAWVRRIFDTVDAVLPVSRATGEACLARGLPESKLHVIPNGVRLDRFRPPADRATMRAALADAVGASVPDDALLLCSVGRQVERKGFAWFVDEVLPRLPDDVHYWLAGVGPERERILEAVRRPGLEKRVRLLGRVSEDQLEHLYRGADLFVMPNVPVPGDMEGFGIVLLEAGMNGTPAVASRLEGIRDVITEGENGHFVPPRQPQAFVDALLPYHHAPERLRAFSERARAHTAATFSWPAVADRYVQVLRSL